MLARTEKDKIFFYWNRIWAFLWMTQRMHTLSVYIEIDTESAPQQKSCDISCNVIMFRNIFEAIILWRTHRKWSVFVEYNLQ